MMWFSGTRNRRPRRSCEACGMTAPLDAVRLRGGRFYCPQGDCRRVAEGLIREARGRLEAAPVAQQVRVLAETPGEAVYMKYDHEVAMARESVVLGPIEREMTAGPILVN
jgi:hypothetical protein